MQVHSPHNRPTYSHNNLQYNLLPPTRSDHISILMSPTNRSNTTQTSNKIFTHAQPDLVSSQTVMPEADWPPSSRTFLFCFSPASGQPPTVFPAQFLKFSHNISVINCSPGSPLLYYCSVSFASFFCSGSLIFTVLAPKRKCNRPPLSISHTPTVALGPARLPLVLLLPLLL